MSKLSLGVSLSAFVFQVRVLYPWHVEISEQINDISKQNKEIIKQLKSS